MAAAGPVFVYFALGVLTLVTGIQLALAAPTFIGVGALGLLAVRRRTLGFALLLLLGMGRGWQAASAWSAVRQLDGQSFAAVGTVGEVEQRATRVRMTLVVGQVAGRPVGVGGVRARFSVRQAVQRGERLRLRCAWEVRERTSVLVPSSPSLACDGPEILSREPPNLAVALLERARVRFVSALQRSLPEPASSLAVGLTLGETWTFDRQVVEDFRTSGTSHVLALSGYNVSVLVAVLLASVPVVLGRRMAFGLILVALAAFLVLTGVPPSLLRATLMGSLLIAARWFGRRATAARLLGLSAALLLAASPALLVDLGFLLSLSATLGLLLLADRVVPWRQAPAFARTIVGGSSAAFLFTLPILVPLFERLSPVAPFANLLVLPIVPVLFFADAGVGLVGLLSPELAAVLGGPIVWLSGAFLGIVSWTARLPFASVAIGVPNVLPWLFPSAVAALVLFWRERPCPICRCPREEAAWRV